MHSIGLNSIAGSTNEKAISGLKSLISIIKKGSSCIITVDGPRGPVFEVQPGIISLAMLTQTPIIPWHFEAKKQWVFNSWDKHKFPYPFTTIVESYGEPIYLPQKIKKESRIEFINKVQYSLHNNMLLCQRLSQ